MGGRRRPVSYGTGEYHEVVFYPLATVGDPNDLDAHRWPTADWFDYSVLPDQIAATRKGDEPQEAGLPFRAVGADARGSS